MLTAEQLDSEYKALDVAKRVLHDERALLQASIDNLDDVPEKRWSNDFQRQLDALVARRNALDLELLRVKRRFRRYQRRAFKFDTRVSRAERLADILFMRSQGKRNSEIRDTLGYEPTRNKLRRERRRVWNVTPATQESAIDD